MSATGALGTLGSRLRLLVTLTRPPVLLLLALYTALGEAGAGQAESKTLLLRAVLPVAAFLLFSVVLNDLADEEIDRVNLPDDPRRPLAGGSVRAGGALRREMLVVAAVAAAVALGGGLLLGLWPAVTVATGLCVSAAYSLRPVRLANRGAVAALILPACYVAVPYLLGRLAAGPRPGGRDALLLAGLYVGFIGRILLKDFRDVRGDALFGKRTFLVRHGRELTCRFSAACWTAGGVLLLAAVPHRTSAFVGVTALQLGAALWLLNRLRSETHPRRETALISALAIVGRGMIIVLLAHLSTGQFHWSGPAQSALLAALCLLTLGQAYSMVRYGPTSRLRVPATEPSDSLAARPSRRVRSSSR